MGDTVSTLLFQPPPPTKLKENKIIWLKTSQGKKIPGFYIHYSNVNGEESSRSLTVKELQSADTEDGITILYSHANAEDLGSIYPWCKFLSKMLRVNLFAYDYTGYGMAFDEGTLDWLDRKEAWFENIEHCLNPIPLFLFQVIHRRSTATLILMRRTSFWDSTWMFLLKMSFFTDDPWDQDHRVTLQRGPLSQKTPVLVGLLEALFFMLHFFRYTVSFWIRAARYMVISSRILIMLPWLSRRWCLFTERQTRLFLSTTLNECMKPCNRKREHVLSISRAWVTTMFIR